MWESELEIKDGTGFCSPSAEWKELFHTVA